MADNITSNILENVNEASAVEDANRTPDRPPANQNEFDTITLLNFSQNVSARKRYSYRIFLITSGWLIAVLTIIILSGLNILKLSDAVLIALLGSTTVNVLGFFVIVIQYLFNKDKST